MNQEQNNNIQEELNTPDVKTEEAQTVEEQSFEEPVMITANIEDLPESERPIIENTSPEETNPKPIEPIEPQQIDVGFELGQKEEPEEKVGTFQQLGDIPIENKVEEEKKEEEKTEVEQLESRTEMPEPIGDSLTELYQAKPTNVPPQQEEKKEEVKEEIIETLEEDEIEEPKKRPKILLVIMFIIILLIIGGLIYIKFFSKNKSQTEPKTLGNINIAIIGDINSNKDKLYTSLIKNVDITKCEEKNLLETKYSTINKVLKTEKRDYNIIYPCGYQDSIKYLVVSDRLEKVDGAILVVKDEVKEQTQEISKVLQNIGVTKIIVFIDKSDDEETNKKVEKEVEDLIIARGFDKTRTPVIIGNITDENDIKKLQTESDSWYENTKIDLESYAIQKHKTIKLYTYLKPTTEGGITSSIKNSDKLEMKINNDKILGEVMLPETITEINAGTNTDITIKLEKETSISNGMRIPFYKDSKIIAIGVVDEIIE